MALARTGGVGPLTITMLMKNTLEAFKKNVISRCEPEVRERCW